MFRDAWDMRLAQAAEITRALQAELTAAEKQIAQLLDRIVEATNPSVIGAYEQRIELLERERRIVSERLEKSTAPQRGLKKCSNSPCNSSQIPGKYGLPAA